MVSVGRLSLAKPFLLSFLPSSPRLYPQVEEAYETFESTALRLIEARKFMPGKQLTPKLDRK